MEYFFLILVCASILWYIFKKSKEADSWVKNRPTAKGESKKNPYSDKNLSGSIKLEKNEDKNFYKDSDEKSKNQITEKKISTRWLTFYIYVVLPFGSIFAFAPMRATIDILCERGISPQINALTLVPLVLNSIFICFAIYGLHQRRSWGLICNWIILIGGVLLSPLTNVKEIGPYIVCATFLIVTWFLPNFFYFYKRRNLFASAVSNTSWKLSLELRNTKILWGLIVGIIFVNIWLIADTKKYLISVFPKQRGLTLEDIQNFKVQEKKAISLAKQTHTFCEPYNNEALLNNGGLEDINKIKRICGWKAQMYSNEIWLVYFITERKDKKFSVLSFEVNLKNGIVRSILDDPILNKKYEKIKPPKGFFQ